MKRCIVVADDDPGIIELVTLRLGMARYNIVAAGDAVAALEKIRAERPMAVILDIQMPGGGDGMPGGLAALARIKADPQLRHLPVMMLTGERNTETVMQAMGDGADDYMVKPFIPDTLLARVGRMIDARAAAPVWEL